MIREDGTRAFGEDLAPRFRLKVEGTEIQADLTQFITEVRFESAIDMVDKMELTIANPDFMFTPRGNAPAAVGEGTMGDATAHRAWAHGNELELWVGYGRADTFLGRAIVQKHLPKFPEEGEPTLDVIAYDKGFLMTKGSGSLQVQDNKTHFDLKKLKQGEADGGHSYLNMTSSQIVERVARKYGFATKIDATAHVNKTAWREGIIQKRGFTDYQLVQALANIEDRVFYVRFDPAAGKWILHWVKPPTTSNVPEWEFVYGTSTATLLSYQAEYGLKDAVNSVVVTVYDHEKQEWISIVEVIDVEGPDPRWKLGGGRMQRQKAVDQENLSDGSKGDSAKTKAKKERAASETGALIKSALKSATQFSIAAGGFQVEFAGAPPFETVEDAAKYAARWFRERRDSFIIAKGRVVGMETLRAGQVHRFKGIGARLSGDYYFIAVNHRIADGQGYFCDYIARKMLED
jgi:hypothetical protein